MIRFSCKQCDKVFQRPEEEAGTLVFCGCGTGNRVPWESTVAEAEAPAEAESPPDTAGPALHARPIGEERAPEVKRPRPRRRTQPEIRSRDPAYCFNHQDIAVQHTCTACGEAFCGDCVVKLQGQTLCGPCKNFRIRSLDRPARMSGLAIVSLVLGLVTGPVGMFCLMPISLGARVPSFGYIAVVLPLVALILGFRALRQIETNPRVGGRSVAIAGVVTSLVASYLTVVLVEVIRRQVD